MSGSIYRNAAKTGCETSVMNWVTAGALRSAFLILPYWEAAYIYMTSWFEILGH
jgi:hypothetical protein